jgi:iron complex outermembrane receptor protein
MDVAGNLSLLAGLRYDNVAFSADDDFVGGGDPDDSGDRAMSAVSPSAGIVVAVGDAVELFGSVGRSFETPTTTELANRPSGAGGFNTDLGPQIGLTIEGGARATMAGRISVEATVFTTELDDELVPFEVATDPGRTYFRNAARSRHSGWELSVDGRIAQEIRARLAYTRVDAVYDFYETDTEVYSGNSVPGLAPHRLDGLVLLERGAAFLELRGLWQDDMPVDDAGTASSPSYFVADARVGIDAARLGNVAIAPFFAVANVFDETYNASVVPNAFGSRYYEPGPGRIYRIGLGVTWGG